MRSLKNSLALIILPVISCNTLIVTAENLPDQATVKLGAYFISSADTDIRINPQGTLLGTNIKYSKDLGGDDQETVPRLSGYYRFNDYHRIDYGYFKVDRDGTRLLDTDIVIGDETYTANSSISSSLNVNIYKISYTHSFYHNEKVELGLSAGLHMMDYKFTANSNNNHHTDNSFMAPLPVVGYLMNYNITSAWSTYVQSDIFFIEVDNNYKGSLTDLRFGTEYRAFKNTGFGINLSRMSLNAEVTDDSFRGSINDVYNGINLYVALYF